MTHIKIREAEESDRYFVEELMHNALEPYYGGDHKLHAKRIFTTHISGGKDYLGHFSLEQKMFIVTVDDVPAGMAHLVGKRQGTYKISPIIVSPNYRKRLGLGKRLLEFAEEYAKSNGARQIYCTVAEQNISALRFFLKQGYTIAGKSESHYKADITEMMLYKPLDKSFEDLFDRDHISVLPLKKEYEANVKELLLSILPKHFKAIDSEWVEALFNGYRRRNSQDINLKYKLIYIAIDRKNNVRGVVGATPKKSHRPVKIMPFIAKDLQSFVALLTDVPYFLKPYGCKLYMHIIPDVNQTIILQQYGWKLDAVMPGAYHPAQVTQQWSFDITKDFIRPLRTRKEYFDLIRSGKKTSEVRVGYEHIKTIKKGERIRFFSHCEFVDCIVSGIRKYSTLEDLLNNEEPSKIIPGLQKEEILKRLRDIYPPELERLGLILFEIELMKD